MIISPARVVVSGEMPARNSRALRAIFSYANLFYADSFCAEQSVWNAERLEALNAGVSVKERV